jgi:hypothetical protein
MENVRVKWTMFYKDLYSFHFYQILLGPSNQESWDGRTHVVLPLCHTPRFTPIQYVLKRFIFLGFLSVFSSVQFWFLRACYQSQLHELYHIRRRLIIFILWFYSSCYNCYKHDVRIYVKKTNKCVWRYVNLLHYRRCKLPTCFGHLFWPPPKTCFTKDILQRQPNQSTIIKY